MIAAPPDTLSAIERPLYLQLAVLAIASMAIGVAARHSDAGIACAAGFACAIAYYALLAVQIRRQLTALRWPGAIAIFVSMAARQAVCFLAVTGCFLYVPHAWWLSLVTLVVGRHWVFAFAWRPVPGAC